LARRSQILLEIQAETGLYSEDPPDAPALEENNVRDRRYSTFALNIASGFPSLSPEVNSDLG